MAKELPYFKFEPSEWTHGNIQMCSDKAKASFIELCCLYWNRLGDCSKKLSIAVSCNRNIDVFNELIDCNIIQLKNDKVVIKFLDNQLQEFNIVKKARAESGRKGGQKGGIRPIEERKKGNQIYILECWNQEECFYKIGTTSNCVSRRYSGKLQYEYKLVFQHFTDDYIDAEKNICEQLKHCEYKPRLNFAGQKECYTHGSFKEIEDVFNNYFNFAKALLKRNDAIREEKIIEDKSKVDKIKPNILSLMSDANASDVTDLNKPYFEISKAFYDIFQNNAEKLEVKWSHLDKSKADKFIQPIRLLIESDKRTIEDLRKVWRFLQTDEFWMPNIQSSSKLRKNFDQLITKAKQHGKENTANDYIESIRHTDLWKNA